MKIVTDYPLYRVYVITLVVICAICNIPCIHTAQQPECNKKDEVEFSYKCLPQGNNKAGPCVPGQRLIMPESSCSPGDVQLDSRICVPCEGDTYIDYHNSCDDCIQRTVCGPNEVPSKENYASDKNRECTCVQCPTGNVSVTCPTCPECTCPTPNLDTTSRTPQSSSTHIELTSTTARDCPSLDAVRTADGVNGYKIAFFVLLAIFIFTAIFLLLKYRDCVAKWHWPTCGGHKKPQANPQNQLDDGQYDPHGCPDGVRVHIPPENSVHSSNQGTPQNVQPQGTPQGSAQNASGDSTHVEDNRGESAEGLEPIPKNDALDTSVDSTHDEASPGESATLLKGSPSAADQGVRNNGDKGARPKVLQNKPFNKDYVVKSGTSSARRLLENSLGNDSIQSNQEPNGHHQTLSNASSLNSNPSHPLESSNTANKVWKAYEKAEGKCGIVTDCSEQHIDFVKDKIDIDTRKDFYAKLGMSSKVVVENEYDARDDLIREKIRYVLLTGFLRKAEDVSISKLLKALQESKNRDVARDFIKVFKAYYS